MRTRLITTTACVLCLALPAAAGASPATDQPTAKGPYGITTATGPQDTVKAHGPYGITTATGPQDTVKAHGPYGMTTATRLQDTVKANGPYGMTTATDSQHSTVDRAGASVTDGTNDWRAAAILEAALLAAVGFGSALLLPAQRRARRVGT
jgi:hypothetical protein